MVDEDRDAVPAQMREIVELLPVGRRFGGRLGGAKREAPTAVGAHRSAVGKPQFNRLNGGKEERIRLNRIRGDELCLLSADRNRKKCMD